MRLILVHMDSYNVPGINGIHLCYIDPMNEIQCMGALFVSGRLPW